VPKEKPHRFNPETSWIEFDAVCPGLGWDPASGSLE